MTAWSSCRHFSYLADRPRGTSAAHLGPKHTARRPQDVVRLLIRAPCRATVESMPKPAAPAKAAPKTKTAKHVTPEGVTKYQRFFSKRIHRSEIKNCPYNPRTISARARKKLKDSIDVEKGGDGLLGPVNFNIVTGNCFGGNQRLAVLDVLEGKPDYYLDVAAAQLTLKKEQAACVRLNNEGVMGSWDLTLLADLLPGMDIDETGFEQIQLETLLGDQGEGIFGDDSVNKETAPAVDDMEAMQAAREEEAEAAKGRRQKMRETTKAEHAKGDTERIGYVMFPSRKAREDWVESLGLDRGERYVPAKLVRPTLEPSTPSPRGKPRARA